MGFEVISGPKIEAAPEDRLTVALSQIAPVFLDKAATTQKIVTAITQASEAGADLVCFGEALLPGYPFWVDRTDGARFESDLQKSWYDIYLREGVDIDGGDLTPIREAARARGIAIYLGAMERAGDRGGHTLYCSLIHITKSGDIASVHRKLQPTYEERLVWGMGDGHGLKVHALGRFTAGGLNCWENWLPLARASLYGQGEDLHVAVWPGGLHNTEDLTPVLAKEGRSYALSVSGLMRPTDVGAHLPAADILRADPAHFFANGGSAIAGPDGAWVIPPVVGKEALLVADIDHAQVRRARLTLDVAGHYSRPDVLSLTVDRQRRATVKLIDGE